MTTSKTIFRRALWLVALGLLSLVIIFPQAYVRGIGAAESVLGVKLDRLKTDRPFVLGLDLQGGTRLEYEADTASIPEAERREALQGVRDVIERRVNSIGVAEPLIQVTQAGDAWRVGVELAGIRDVNEAKDLIGKTPILEFKVPSNEPARELTADEQKRLTDEQAAAQNRANALLAEAKKPGVDFEKLVKEKTEITARKENGGETGFMLGKEEWNAVYQELRNEPVGLVNRVVNAGKTLVIAKVEERKQVNTEAEGSHILISWAGAERSTSTSTKEQARAQIEKIKKEVTVQNFTEKARQYSMEPGAKESGGDLGWFQKGGGLVESFETPYFAQKVGTISDIIETPFGYHLIYKKDERAIYDVRARVLEVKRLVKEDIVPSDGWAATKLTGKQLKTARVDFSQQTGQVMVALEFNDEGRDLFAKLTREQRGNYIGIFVDGELIRAPQVSEEIPSGQAVITNMGLEEARELARNMQAGALPIPIQLISQQTIGPSLGADSLQASLMAGLIGFVLVALFMVLIYRVPGLVAILALALYAGISLAVFKLIPVTLTLAGLAGFILSLGIAVDANVLAFERLKEEWRLGKTLTAALEDAFRRAWPSIRDGHVTVLISCAVLYGFSSSLIRGFAVTLAIGVLISLFTAVVTCRTWLRAIARTRLGVNEWLFLKPRR